MLVVRLTGLFVCKSNSADDCCVVDWIATIPGKPLKVLCTFCDVELNANLKDVKRHDKTLKHARNVEEHSPSPTKSRKSTAEGYSCSLSVFFLRDFSPHYLAEMFLGLSLPVKWGFNR